MSSDDYFDDDAELDSKFLAELDVIEAVHSNTVSATQPGHPAKRATPASFNATKTSLTTLSAPFGPIKSSILNPESPATTSPIIDIDSDDTYDNDFDNVDPAELERLDKDVEDAYKHGIGRQRSNFHSSTQATHQLTLFGDALPTPAPRPQRPSQQTSAYTSSGPSRNPFGQKPKKTKAWDHTLFAKSGWKLGKNSKGKGNPATKDPDEDVDMDESTEEFEQFPAPSRYPTAPPPRSKLSLDVLAAKTWIFPTNQPKRDYQFNIVKEALFENTLVAVPTGLGKTFIAGVVMLNYYRWFPQGKVIFVAPTKPLVAQQIEACHKICGIPGGDAIELTGQNSRGNRANAWGEKRVFYMTPQTLMNDLKTNNCDPTNIILLVIDEAHRATGDYAYAQVVRYLMATNFHFRILGLTATPGSKPEAVQAIVDSLHISHIELRDENSIDLRAYMQHKEISTRIIKMNEGVVKIRDMLVKIMDKTAKRLVEAGLLPNYNPIKLHSYRCNALMRQYSQNGTSKKSPWLFSSFKKLGALARAMGYLLECSIAICHQTLQELTSDETTKKKSEKGSDSLRSDPLFHDLIDELERQRVVGYPLHPKMETLESIVVDYFVQSTADIQGESAQDNDQEVPAEGASTKMMVFTNFRASVDEIVDVLKTHHPIVRATPFIGQGMDKNGKRGIAQKEQLQVIQKFKEGVFNVLVSTSIGEEGLDIGEVDMIVCYDAQKTPIRMLQRVGRTGRKRAGKVAVLLSENREEANWQKAKSDYECVQTSIVRGDALELFGDVDRLLPDNIRPKCSEMPMPIEEYVRETQPTKSLCFPKGTKRKRNADVDRNIPEGAWKGFIPSSKLVRKGASKKQKLSSKDCNLDDIVDDEDDLEIQAGLEGILASKSKPGNDKVAVKKPTKKVGSLGSRRKKPIPEKSSADDSEITPSQLSLMLEKDRDDMELERGIDFSSPERSLTQCPNPTSRTPLKSEPVAAQSSTMPLIDEKATESPHSWLLHSDSEVEVIHDAPLSPDSLEVQSVDHSPPKTPSKEWSALSQASEGKIRTLQDDMPNYPSGSTPITSPDLSFSIRPLDFRRKRKQIESSSPLPTSESPIIPAQLPPPKPLPPRASSPPRVKRHRKSIKADEANIWLDLEAEVSGDDVLGDSSDVEDLENETDRRFVEELAATQASPSYDQSAAYYRSLLTQVPDGRGVPRFSTKPVRRGAFGIGRQRVNLQVSSSPGRDDAPDQYSIGSFVVEDDDMIDQDYDQSSGL